MSHDRWVPSRNAGLILALDVTTAEELRRLVELVAGLPQVVALKPGFMLAARIGLPKVVQILREFTQKPIIYDHQKAGTDIPQMGAAFAELCRDASVDACIVFPHSGPAVLEAFVRSALDVQITPIVGLAMSHPQYLRSEGGYIDDAAPSEIFSAAMALGVREFVLPATKLGLTSSLARATRDSEASRSLSFFVPGIGRQGGDVLSAKRAVAPHTVFPIVGSSVYNATDPVDVLRKFALALAAD